MQIYNNFPLAIQQNHLIALHAIHENLPDYHEWGFQDEYPNILVTWLLNGGLLIRYWLCQMVKVKTVAPGDETVSILPP